MLRKTRTIRLVRLCLIGALLFLPLAGCAPSYSPDTYSSNATQQANKVDQGIVVGVRPVTISADAALGSATGAAAGGIAGSQMGVGATSALGALGGSVAGGVVGNVVSHAAGDTDGFEYIVKKPNGDLLSVTQKDVAPLGVGAHVLIIEGPQARIVADYTVPIVVEPLHPAEAPKPSAANTPGSPPGGSAGAITASPLPPPEAKDADGDKKPDAVHAAPPPIDSI